MSTQQDRSSNISQDHPDSERALAGAKHEWREPKLRFVEPKLIERGPVKDLTGGFFGSFSP